jgi:hypothetical protein
VIPVAVDQENITVHVEYMFQLGADITCGISKVEGDERVQVLL